jgi:hypothetical protein
VALAKRTGNPTVIAEQTDKLAEAQDELDEAITKGVEDRRALIRQAAQDAVDQAQFGVESAHNVLAGLDISQRLARTAETPGGERQKAAGIESTLVPALQVNLGALNTQLAKLKETGASGAEINQVLLSIQTAGNDIGNAMAEAADLIKQAAEQAAEEVVTHAAHVTSLTTLGEQKLELEQRLAGTFDAGGQQRADYINTQLIPALNTELAALQAQERTAAEQGDPKLAEQIGEAVASKQNDILQAQLDAQEDIKANTEPRKVGGTLGFAFEGSTLTDSIIGVGSGA